MSPMQFGIRINLGQFLQQLLQVLLVGMTIGMMRNVVPALAEGEFGVPRGSFLLLVAFVVAFGFVKGSMNFVAGRLAERIGRKRVLLLGWLVALPIPMLTMDKQAFVDALTAEIPPPPADMASIVEANLRGVVPEAAHA